MIHVYSEYILMSNQSYWLAYEIMLLYAYVYHRRKRILYASWASIFPRTAPKIRDGFQLELD